MRARRWRLELGDEVVAVIDCDFYEFPWTYGELVDSSRFERFRLYFSNSDAWPEHDAELEKLLGEIKSRGGFSIRDMSSGTAYRSPGLHHDGSLVWFRHGNPVESAVPPARPWWRFW